MSKYTLAIIVISAGIVSAILLEQSILDAIDAFSQWYWGKA